MNTSPEQRLVFCNSLEELCREIDDTVINAGMASALKQRAFHDLEKFPPPAIVKFDADVPELTDTEIAAFFEEQTK